MMNSFFFLSLVLCFLALFSMVGLWFLFKSKIKASERAQEELFRNLSYDLMEKNGKSFLDLATLSLEKYQVGAKADLESRQKAIETSLTPVKEAIKQLEANTRELEKRREGAYASLSKQLETMVVAEKELRLETHHLVQALRSPQIRGSWGELHLKRVVELAGLVNQCDFYEQQTVGQEKIIRPDLVVRLPGDRQIVIDAKTPLEAYLDASDAGDDSLRKKKLIDHALHLRKHIKELSSKEYWKQFQRAPEYVILFLPAEAFFSAALQVDPTLIEIGADHNIIVATPTTLIAILRAVAFSWKQDGLSKNAADIAKLGHELYERMGVVLDHWSRVGRHLNTAVDAYNQAVGSVESRVLVSIRKLKETASISKEVTSLDPVEKIAKTIKTIEVAKEPEVTNQEQL